MDMVRYLDGLGAPFLSLATQADMSDVPVYAKTLAFTLKGKVEARQLVVSAAPQAESASSRVERDAPATQSASA